MGALAKPLANGSALVTKRSVKGEGSVYKYRDGWQGYITVDGKRKYFTGKTRVEAAQKLRQLLNQRDIGEISTGRAPKVGEWLDKWLEISRKDHRESTHVGYTGYVNNYIKPAIGGIRLDKLTIDRLTDFYTALEDRGLSGSTRHQVHSIIRVALKHAVWRGVVSRNVATLVKPPSIPKTHVTGFGKEELQAIGLALMGNRYEARWHIGLGLGLRPGEAIALEWKHINFEKSEITVNQQLQQIDGQGTKLIPHTKTSSSTRVIPAPKYIMRMLKETEERQVREMIEAGDEWNPWSPDGEVHGFCFTQLDGQPLRPGLDIVEWRNILKQAGVPQRRRYAARHTAASWMIANGVDAVSVSKILGHRNANFTMDQYVHAVDDNLRTAMQKIDDFHDRNS